jgi:hypothetical protein
MGTQRKVHNLRDSSETHGTISNTTNIHPSPSTDRNPTMTITPTCDTCAAPATIQLELEPPTYICNACALPVTVRASGMFEEPSVWVSLDSYTKQAGGSPQSPALTAEQARALAADLIASAESAERHAAELAAAREASRPTLRAFTVSLSVVAPAGMSDADLAGIIDLTDWAGGIQIQHNVTIDDVQIMEKQAPFGTTTVASLFMDNITIDSYSGIPRVYINAAEDWITYGNEQDGVGKLAKLLWALDTNREVQ